MSWIETHWPLIVMLGTPPLGILVATIVSTFGDPDNDPRTPPPLWVVPFVVIQQLMTLRAAPGRKGIEGIGDGRWSFPLVHYPIPGEPVPAKPTPPPGASGPLPPGVAPLLLLAALTLAGCVAGAVASLGIAESVNVKARQQFPGVDALKRAQIVRMAPDEPEGQKRLAAWSETADALVKVIDGTHASAKLGRAALQEIADGKRSKGEVQQWIGPVLAAAAHLKEVLAAAGVPLVE